LFYTTVLTFAFAGIVGLISHHQANALSDFPYWLAAVLRISPYLSLALVPLSCASYCLTYFETRPDSLECRRFWHCRTISYSEISRISCDRRWLWVTINLRYASLSNLPMFVDKPAEFMADISGHAPLAQIV